MFFFLSKTLDLLLDPWWWAAAPIAVGVGLLARGRRRAGLIVALCGLAVLVVLSLPLVSDRLWHALEAGAVSTARPDVTYEVVVLLGGVVSPSGSTAQQVAWGDNVERLTVTFDLLLAGRARKVLVTGGALGRGLPAEAEFLSKQLRAWGIAEDRILVEPRARNTAENAEFSRALLEPLAPASLLLVTSAFHAPRAVECFRAAGLQPDVLPVDYRVREPGEGPWLPRARHLADSAEAIREFAGRLVYRLR